MTCLEASDIREEEHHMTNRDLSQGGRAAGALGAALGLPAPHRRMWTAAGTALALLLVGILLAVFLVMRLATNAKSLTERQIQYATALSSAAINAKGIANDERGYLLSGNREFLVEIDIRTGLARESFDRAAQAADDDQSRRILQAYGVFEQWLVALEEEIALFRSGDREAARAASLGRTRELRKEYEALLATAALTESGVPDAAASLSSSAARSVAILFAYLLFAIIVVLTVNAWATRGLARTHLGSSPESRHETWMNAS
jgi:methyl-accepting chemotaxis protein